MRDSRAYLLNGVGILVFWLLGRILLFLVSFCHLWQHLHEVRTVRMVQRGRMQCILDAAPRAAQPCVRCSGGVCGWVLGGGEGARASGALPQRVVPKASQPCLPASPAGLQLSWPTLTFIAITPLPLFLLNCFWFSKIVRGALKLFLGSPEQRVRMVLDPHLNDRALSHAALAGAKVVE